MHQMAEPNEKLVDFFYILINDNSLKVWYCCSQLIWICSYNMNQMAEPDEKLVDFSFILINDNSLKIFCFHKQNETT